MSSEVSCVDTLLLQYAFLERFDAFHVFSQMTVLLMLI